MNIAQVLREQALTSPDAPAIIDPSRTVTFAELDRLSAHVARQLAAERVRPGDHVLVLCPMSVALYAVLIGLWRLGAIAVVLDPSAGARHIDACCRRVPLRAFAAVPRAHLLRIMSAALRRVPVHLAVNGWVPGARRLNLNAAPGGPDGAVAPVAPDTPALVTFTSGSTGEPKAAVRTHGFLLAQHRVLAEDLRLQRGQRDLATLPIFVLANLASGVTSIIPDVDLRRPGEIDPARLLRQIRAVSPTRVAASPALLDRLAAHMASLHDQLTGFDEIYTGGAPVFPSLLQRVHAVAPQARLVAVYGSTEAEPIAQVAWDEVGAGDLRAMESGAGLLAGRPVAAIELRVLPDRWGTPLGPFSQQQFEGQALGAGEPGEIVVCGAHVLRGYLGGVGDAETKVRVGDDVWHRTGDAGYLDRNGRLWLLGRCSARIADSRGVLYPFAAECAALTVPGVRRCALVARNGRRVLAIEGEPASGDVRDTIRERLRWAAIDDVFLLDRVPVDRRHNAKVDYPALAATIDRVSKRIERDR